MEKVDFASAIRWLWERRLYLILAVLILFIRLPFIEREASPREQIQMTELYQEFNENVKERLMDPQKLILVSALSFLVMGILTAGGILLFTWGVGFIRRSSFVWQAVPWNLWDVFRVVILSFFWGQSLFVIASLGFQRPEFEKTSEHLLMLLGTLCLDCFVFIFIFYVAIHQAKGSLAHLGLKMNRFLSNVATGILGYLSALPVLFLTLLAVLGIAELLKYELPPQPVQELFLMEKGQGTLLLAMALVALLGPFFEELFFRGLLYNTLKKHLRPVRALWLTSAIFAAVHANLFGFFPILVLSALLTLLYEKTGSLVSSITVHVMHNSFMIGFLLWMKGLGGV